MTDNKDICIHYSTRQGSCTYNKGVAMKFLNEVGAIIPNGPKQTSVDMSKWRHEDWVKYNELMTKLASGNRGLNLPTGRIGCGPFRLGVNPDCNQWQLPNEQSGLINIDESRRLSRIKTNSRP